MEEIGAETGAETGAVVDLIAGAAGSATRARSPRERVAVQPPRVLVRIGLPGAIAIAARAQGAAAAVASARVAESASRKVRSSS